MAYEVRQQTENLNRNFRTEAEATTFATEESNVRTGQIYVVKSAGIYWVDQQRFLRDFETLIGIYENGSQV